MSKNGKFLVGLLVGGLLLGGVGFMSNGFTNWSPEDWGNKIKPSLPVTESESDPELEPEPSEEVPVDTRVNLVSFDFETTVGNRSLTADTIIQYFNKSITPGIVDHVMLDDEFDVYGYDEFDYSGKIDVENPRIFTSVFEDNYLKFGSASKLGFVALKLKENFTFTHIKVVGRNYGNLNTTTGVWSSDTSALEVNGFKFNQFSTNAEDTSVAPPFETLETSFASPQDHLFLNTIGKRLQIRTIELWTVAEDTTKDAPLGIHRMEAFGQANKKTLTLNITPADADIGVITWNSNNAKVIVTKVGDGRSAEVYATGYLPANEFATITVTESLSGLTATGKVYAIGKTELKDGPVPPHNYAVEVVGGDVGKKLADRNVLHFGIIKVPFTEEYQAAKLKIAYSGSQAPVVKYIGLHQGRTTQTASASYNRYSASGISVAEYDIYIFAGDPQYGNQPIIYDIYTPSYADGPTADWKNGVKIGSLSISTSKNVQSLGIIDTSIFE